MKKKIIAFVLAVFIVLGTVSIKGGVQAATNTVTVKASQISGCKYCVKDIKGNLRLEINESVDLTIDMDVDLNLTGISNYYKVYPNISITLKGNKTLTLSTISIKSTRNGGYGLLNITSGVTLNAKSIKADEITVDSGASVNLENLDNVHVDTESPIMSKSFVSSGNLSLVALEAECIRSDYIEIKGGKVTSEVTGSAFKANKVVISGGYLDLKDTLDASGPAYDLSPICANTFVLDPSLYIKEPEGAVWKATKFRSGLYDKNGNIAKHVIIDKKPAGYDDGSSGSGSGNAGGYSNEWINGKWYNADGSQTYKGTLNWKSDANGWWVEDTDGWYPANAWQKIDGTWYFFKPDGYMAMSEYYGGYWFNADGSWDSQYFLSWKSDTTGWWVEDKSGWWPASSWLKIDGYWYYFDASGYMVTNKYVDGYWIGSDGVCY